MRTKPLKVVVIGAGAGGLAAAIDLARQGHGVTVLERGAAPGGKMAPVTVDNRSVDAGPTVFTMKWIFEGLFADAGASFEARLRLKAADVLARHTWRAGGRLDLYADQERTADAIGAFAGAADARGFRNFCSESADIYRTLREPFIAGQRPSLPGLIARAGPSNLMALARTRSMETLWGALGRRFRDPRLRQLFGRYATYVGSSPFSTPATLMLIAHVEREGVWFVDGGIKALADALATLAAEKGASIRYQAEAATISTANGRAAGVVLRSGERIEADAVVFNGDSAALGAGLLSEPAQRAAPPTLPAQRALSAVTWVGVARPEGFALEHHNVFFAEDYAAEFDAVFRDGTITPAPTVYVCAQDRGGGASPSGPERLLILINAPARGDDPAAASLFDGAPAQAALADRAFSLLAACGLSFSAQGRELRLSTPRDFAARFPATGGSLYGRASHGMWSSFTRLGARSRLAGLYLAGGSVHPGPGLPMATMSGRLAAAQLLADFGA